MNAGKTSFSKISAIKNGTIPFEVLPSLNTHVTTTTSPAYQNINQFITQNVESAVNARNLKTWRSDTNLHMYANQQLTQQQMMADDEEDDEVNDILYNNRQLEFSDHAGLYDILNRQHNADSNNIDLEEEVEASLNLNTINKPKTYDLSKINYKLTYDQQKLIYNKQDIFDLNLIKAAKNSEEQINQDSLILNTSLNGLLLQQSDYEYDHREVENEYYTNAASSGANYMEENSLMDWSMKLSNFEQCLLSPLKPPLQPLSSLANPRRGNSKKITPHNKTSWGKLKHSKSSSSNLSKEVHADNRPANTNPLSSVSSTSLLKNFQSFKLTHSSSNSVTTSTTSSNNDHNANSIDVEKNKKTTNFSQLRQRSMSSLANEANVTNVMINSSLSHNNSKNNCSSTVKSCSNNMRNHHVLLPPSLRPSYVSNPTAYVSNKQTTLPPPQPTLPTHTPTIICMVVDKNQKNSLKKEDLQALAAKLALQINAITMQQKHQQKISSSTKSKKASLPDLTFLKKYDTRKTTTQTTKQALSAEYAKNNTENGNHSFHKDEQLPINDVEDDESNGQSDLATKASSLLASGDLLKRKTLKSIKRYRQTKQNTEPCGPGAISDNNSITETATIPIYHTQKIVDSTHHFSLNKFHQPQINEEDEDTSFIQNQTHFDKPESCLNDSSSLSTNSASTTNKSKKLKSCLKRKEQTTSKSRQLSSSICEPNQPQASKSLKPSKTNSDTDISLFSSTESSAMTATAFAISLRISTVMFVPCVGYLFTCDHDSVNRYCYYNNLESRRRAKLYKEFIRRTEKNISCHQNSQEEEEEEEEQEDDEEDVDDDDDDYEDMDPTATISNDPFNNNTLNINSKICIAVSKSESDLRFGGVRKAVTFLTTNVNKTKKCKSSKRSASTLTTSTSGSDTDSLSHGEEANEAVQNFQVKGFGANSTYRSKSLSSNAAATATAPLLHYNTLMAALKSSRKKQTLDMKLQEQHNMNSFSVQINNKINLLLDEQRRESVSIKENQVNTSKDSNKKNSGSVSERNGVSKINKSNIKTKLYQQTIDSDQISIASLSESPPSEFKFSDDDDDHVNDQDRINRSKTITNLNNYNNNNNKAIRAAAQLENEEQQILAKVNHAKLAELKKMKKEFHKMLLKDPRLNNLKETLLEIKQAQHKLKTHFNQSSSPGSISSSSLSLSTTTAVLHSAMPTELREGIEKLSQCIFDFLKTSLKPIESSSFNMVKSIANESPLLKQKLSPKLHHHLTAATDSGILTQTFSQYLQIWNLVEFTINLNIVQNEQQNGVQLDSCYFNLSKDVYLSIFQEINKYEHAINQTYLIDTESSATSQLRRKHYFMVVLMSLKFKFQLFIVNLLNHRQLANWFHFLNKNKDMLKNFYAFKNLSSLLNNNSGDSGVSGVSSEFMMTNSALTNQNKTDFAYSSLVNVSLFENEEYFSYFYKLVEQFGFIEFNLKLINNAQPTSATLSTAYTGNGQNNNMPPKFKTQQVAELQMNKLLETQLPKRDGKLNSPSVSKVIIDNKSIYNQNQQNKPLATKSSHNISSGSASSTGSGGGGNGFNFKSISKKFNIKSWFGSNSTNSANSQVISTKPPTGIAKTISGSSTTPHISNFLKNNHNSISQVAALQRINNEIQNEMNNSKLGMVGCGVGALVNDSSNLMKHSLSESHLNQSFK